MLILTKGMTLLKEEHHLIRSRHSSAREILLTPTKSVTFLTEEHHLLVKGVTFLTEGGEWYSSVRKVTPLVRVSSISPSGWSCPCLE